MTLSNLRLYDNTRISEFRRCPRFYFFRHVMHWKMNSASELALIFGGAWHAAMDEMWANVAANVPAQDNINHAYDAFVHHWTDNGMDHPSEIDLERSKELAPRTPMVAKEMLHAYYDARVRAIREVEIVEIERPFAVPLSPNDPTLFYVGRIDKVVRPSKGRIRGIEHKTTTAVALSYGARTKGEHKIRGSFLDSFSPNSQVDGYSYAMHLLYPKDRADIWVDAALVHAKGEDFQFVPVERRMDQLDAWLYETHRWIEGIELEAKRLQECSEGDHFMAAYPKNTNACFDFNRPCPFLDLCKARANPLSYEGVPSGYKEEKWDPLEHLGTPKELA